LPVVPIVRGTDVPATELRVVKDVIHLRPEQQHALLVLQREVLGERHVPVVRTRTRNGYDTAGSGVAEAFHRFSDAHLRSGRRRVTARVRNLERAFVDELVARRPVGAVAAYRRA